MRAESLASFAFCGTGTSSSNPKPRLRNRDRRLQDAARPCVQALEQRMLMSASLIKDINTTLADANPGNFVVFNNELYFTANNGSGTQLYETNGTLAGTVPVTNLVPNEPNSVPFDLTVANGSLYFFATGPSDLALQYNLYRSDGTAAGTTLITTALQSPNELTSVGGLLYFNAYAGTATQQTLWRSDGTAAGTFSLQVPAGNVINDNGTAYFAQGNTIWKTDGTVAGTMEAFADPNPKDIIGQLIAVNGTLYFNTYTSLWASNGTQAGTYDVRDFVGQPEGLMQLNGALYFGTMDSTALWTSNGTAAGTTIVSANGTPSPYVPYATLNGKLYYIGYDQANGSELWTTDGTAAGTSLVDDLYPGSQDAVQPINGNGVVAFNGEVYFAANDGIHGTQLWRSNGTAAGTQEFDQINSTPNSSDPGEYDTNASATIDGITYFAADDGTDGWGLWRTDGTNAGTTLVGDYDPTNLIAFNDELYFDDGGNLYKSGGLALATSVIAANVWPTDFTPVGNLLYFFGNNASGEALMVLNTDTDQVSTIMTVQPNVTAQYSYDGGIADFNGEIYFTVFTQTNQMSIWKTDGTSAGTSEIASFAGGTGADGPSFATTQDALFFIANDGTNGTAIWKTDGTSAGTTMVWAPGAQYSSPADLYAFDNAVYFSVLSIEYGRQYDGIYRTDGTSAGTVEISSASSSGTPPVFTTSGDQLFFTDNAPGGYNTTLYVSDGTAAGTKPVDPSLIFNPQLDSSPMLSANGLLYFIASDGTHGAELWQTDGTTTQLADPSETAAGWTVYNMIGQSGNTLLFAASDPAHGDELWGLPLTPEATTATLQKVDTTTSGNWHGTYGSDGYDIIGGGVSLPSYVTLPTSYVQYYQWAGPGYADDRAPEIGADTNTREAACDFGEYSFSINLSFNDNQTHQVALYLLDDDYQNRQETVQITNTLTGQLLSSQTVSSFQNGTYLVYNLSGNITINFINVAGSLNAVLSAIFFDPARTTPVSAIYAGVDSTTEGRWSGTYGSQGYDVIGGSSNLPSDVDVTFNGEQYYTWAASTTDPRAPQTSPGSSTGVAACAYSNNASFTIDVDFLDDSTHELSLYLLDYDYQNRAETIQISNAVTGAVLDTETLSHFTGGEYERWDVSGNVKITISNAGGLNEVVSGLFIDPATSAAPGATFVKTDSTTQGTYTGVYGAAGYDLLGTSYAVQPAYATLGIPRNLPTYTWAANTTSVNALQDSPGSSSRVAACLYSNYPSFSFDLDITDGQTHQVALYFLDYDSQGRSETVQITNAMTNQVLDTETVSNFTGGKYLVWDLSGNVNITITNSGGLNEVLSGIFFG